MNHCNFTYYIVRWPVLILDVVMVEGIRLILRNPICTTCGCDEGLRHVATATVDKHTVLLGVGIPGVWTNDVVSRGRRVVARASRPRRCWKLPCAPQPEVGVA
jgi:hypothetical protein